MKTLKETHLAQLDAYVQNLYRQPQLRHLFMELTLRCNEHCFHCGSSCTAAGGDELTGAEWCEQLDQVKEDFGTERLMLCITGGEPLLRADFFDIMDYAHKLGFCWGMTSNATLITRDVAHRLAEAGMGTISVSIDGLPETHDRLRGLTGGYERAMRGVQNLIDEGAFRAVQITTVVNHATMDQLNALFAVMDGIDIDSWRVIGLEPIGRALAHTQLMLTPNDQQALFDFIREKRAQGYPVTYGCSHYLGLELEHEVRDWYWMCNAGVYTASIMANGDVGACLDIERRPETVQGNVRKRRFSDIWTSEFALFRQDLSELGAECQSCEHKRVCRGGAHHSWNYDEKRQMICLKGVLF